MQSIRSKVFGRQGPATGSGAGAGAAARASNPLAVLDCSPDEVECRRLLLHQEAVAGVAEGYAASMMRVLNDLASVHESLHSDLKEAGDIVAEEWVHRSGGLGDALRGHAETGQRALQESSVQIAQARAEHRETLRLTMESDAAARKYNHYERKVGTLRVQVQEARASLGTQALDPEVDKGGRLSRGITQRKTNNCDLKQGQLCRNEEKMALCGERHQAARAISMRALVSTVTTGRQRLRVIVASLFKGCFEGLLPGIQQVILAAAKNASSPAPSSSGPSSAGGYPNMAKVPPPKAPDNAGLPMFAIGEVVTVTGLASAPQWNGAAGAVRSLRQDGRIEVELGMEDPAAATTAISTPGASCTAMSRINKVLALKPDNLVRGADAARREPPCSSAFLTSGAELLSLTEWPCIGQSDGEDSSDNNG